MQRCVVKEDNNIMIKDEFHRSMMRGRRARKDRRGTLYVRVVIEKLRRNVEFCGKEREMFVMEQ